MSSRYNAADIEVLSGLDPVKRRPGMYTDTSRPNHLAQEVIDNSVDEALAGHAKAIDVVMHADGSVEVTDDGRGPADEAAGTGLRGLRERAAAVGATVVTRSLSPGFSLSVVRA